MDSHRSNLSSKTLESLPRDDSLRARCLNSIQKMDTFDFFSEAGPKSKLANLARHMEPIFDRVIEPQLAQMDELFTNQMLKLKSLETIRRDPSQSNICFHDAANTELMKRKNKASFFDNTPAIITDKKRSLLASSPSMVQQRWGQVDKELKESFMRQAKNMIHNAYRESLHQIMLDHPMFESALQQILDIEEQTALKVQQRRERDQQHKKASSLSPTKTFSRGETSLFKPSRGNGDFTDAVNVHIDPKSYHKESDMIKEICHSYEGILEENKLLRDRLKKLKMQHDKETGVQKHNQFVMADKDMKLLQQVRMLKQSQKMNGIPDRSDDALDDYETKIVSVEWFDALEGIDADTRQELNFKLARVRNTFQELLDINLQSVDKLKNQIQLMNNLTADAYSIANLSLVEIFLGVAKKENDPARIWKGLKRAYGEDYFITVIEEQYGQRFVANYNALYVEVNKVQEQADDQLKEIEAVCKKEVTEQKKLVQQLRQELALYRENFREQIHMIQEQTKVALEKDFEQRESRLYQEQIKREQELQKEIDERDTLYQNHRESIESLKLRMAFDKVRLIGFVNKIPANSSEQDMIRTQILGFLRGTTCTKEQEMATNHKTQVDALELMNKDLCEQIGSLDYKNTMLEDQIKLLDQKIGEIGNKITSAENRQQIAYEEKRKAMTDVKSLRLLNENLEGIIESHEREKQRLLTELRRFTRGKIRSNVLEAELHRKQKQNEIVKRGNKASSKIFVGVDTQKGVQTEIGGLKGHLLYMNDKEYQEKFCKQFQSANTQTVPIEQPKIDSQTLTATPSRPQLSSIEQNSSRNRKLQSGQQSRSNNKERQRVYASQGEAARAQYNVRVSSGLQSQANQSSKQHAKEEYNASGSQRNTDMDDVASSRNSRGGSSFHDSLAKTMNPQRVDIGITCNIITQSGIMSRRRSTNPRQSIKNVVTRVGSNSKNRLSESNNSADGGVSGSLSRMNPQFSQRSQGEAGKSPERERMPTLEELNADEIDDDTYSEDGDIVNLPLGHSGMDQFQNEFRPQKKKKGARKNKQATAAQNKTTAAKQLAAGWRIVNERLRDIEQLEKRNKSQIKYEVDKAFEMAKYLDETNFSKRDPNTSSAYTSMVQMCMSNLDQLTPYMILQKLDQEKKDLQKLLTVDPSMMRAQSGSVSKILNFVCLENLNNQIMRVFNQVIKQSLPASISDVTVNAQDRAHFDSIQIVENNQRNAVSQQLHRIPTTQPVTLEGSGQNILESGLQGRSIHTPRNLAGLGLNHHSSQQSLHQGIFATSSQGTNISPSMTSTNYVNVLSQKMHQSQPAFYQKRNSGSKTHGDKIGSVPRRSIESIISVKSTNMSSNNQFNQSLAKPSEANADLKVHKLISESKCSLRANIEKTFLSSSQKEALEARLLAARRFNGKGFQSLLTSQKLQNKQERNSVGGKNAEKKQYMIYREKMRNFMNPKQPQSNLFKQMARTSGPSDFALKSHQVKNEDQDQEKRGFTTVKTKYIEDNNTDNEGVNQGSLEHSDGSRERILEPSMLKIMQEGRRTADIRIKSQTVYNLEAGSRAHVLAQTNLKGSRTNKGHSSQMRQTSQSFLPSSINPDSKSDQLQQQYMQSDVNFNRKKPSSYLDYIKTSQQQQNQSSVFLERNAYLNNGTDESQLSTSQQYLQEFRPNNAQQRSESQIESSVSGGYGPDKKAIKKSTSEIVVKIQPHDQTRNHLNRGSSYNQVQTSLDDERLSSQEALQPQLVSKIQKAQKKIEKMEPSLKDSNYLTQSMLDRQAISASDLNAVSKTCESQTSLKKSELGKKVRKRNNYQSSTFATYQSNKKTQQGYSLPRTFTK